MRWELAWSSLGLCRMYQEDCYEHVGRSSEEDRETHYREYRRLPDYGSESELKVEGGKAVVKYKVSQGFQSRLEKMGQMTYEFSYRVALERFQAKYLESSIEDDPFAKRPEDTNMRTKHAGPLMIVLLVRSEFP
ncbi:hypothetical protein B296_00052897 [Ensete ventricosum]|uniref:Uncharacterized protein n=1 Tax=Ensete ventricosum TaxID=4639 RepID=A0A426YAK0_ENSVE|nr:hypothetical protein B296_00052897 [Ensete ventricosum]